MGVVPFLQIAYFLKIMAQDVTSSVTYTYMFQGQALTDKKYMAWVPGTTSTPRKPNQAAGQGKESEHGPHEGTLP